MVHAHRDDARPTLLALKRRHAKKKRYLTVSIRTSIVSSKYFGQMKRKQVRKKPDPHVNGPNATKALRCARPAEAISTSAPTWGRSAYQERR